MPQPWTKCSAVRLGMPSCSPVRTKRSARSLSSGSRSRTRPGGLVRPALQLIRSTESDDVPAVIAHLDNTVKRPSAEPGKV